MRWWKNEKSPEIPLTFSYFNSLKHKFPLASTLSNRRLICIALYLFKLWNKMMTMMIACKLQLHCIFVLCMKASFFSTESRKFSFQQASSQWSSELEWREWSVWAVKRGVYSSFKSVAMGRWAVVYRHKSKYHGQRWMAICCGFSKVIVAFPTLVFFKCSFFVHLFVYVFLKK